MTHSRQAARAVAAILTIALVASLTIALAGCSTSAMKSAQAGAGSKKMMMAKAPADPSIQVCGDCSGKGMAPMVKGAAVDGKGGQVVQISVKNGFYSPNDIMVMAGKPVTVVFTGKATGCLAKPRFTSLNMSGVFAGSGATALELGALKPGVYKFTCGMGMNGGKIVAQ
jgi:hypothetical protein